MNTKKLKEDIKTMTEFTRRTVRDLKESYSYEELGKITGVDVATLCNFANEKLTPNIYRVIDIYEKLENLKNRNCD